MSSNTTIDIIMVNYRGSEDTLAAIAGLSPWAHGRIWVVDNSEDTEEAARLSLALANAPEVELVVAERNLGFGQGCNLAYSRSLAEFVLLLNPDARITERAIAQLVEVMEANPRWGALSPNTYWDRQQRFLLPPPFPMTPASRLAMAVASRMPPSLIRAGALRRLEGMRQATARSHPFAVPFLVGAVLLLRRSAVDEAGGLFDPAFFMFFEDSDLSLRLRKKGYALGMVPAARAVHGYRHKPYKLAMMAESEKIYYPKHFPFVCRITRQLARLDGLGRAIDWSAVVARDLGPIQSAAALADRLDGGGVLAIGLSPLLEAVVYRPKDAEPVLLSQEDWQQLEPGRYVVVTGRSEATAMLAFEKPGETTGTA